LPEAVSLLNINQILNIEPAFEKWQSPISKGVPHTHVHNSKIVAFKGLSRTAVDKPGEPGENLMRGVLHFFSFILGVLLALTFLGISGLITARILMERLTALPEKPIFEDEKPQPAKARSPQPAASPSPPKQVPPTPSVPASPTPSPSPSPKPDPNTYEARVTYPTGLILRQQPATDASRVGGVDYNQQVLILEESADGAWLRVRLSNGQEGWVKSGNTKPIN